MALCPKITRFYIVRPVTVREGGSAGAGPPGDKGHATEAEAKAGGLTLDGKFVTFKPTDPIVGVHERTMKREREV